jgi:Aspartyl protease/PDZ domain
MKRPLAVIGLVLALTIPAFAIPPGGTRGPHHSSSSSTKPKVYVKGYHKRDGTYVAPHYRAAPGTSRPIGAPTRGPRTRRSEIAAGDCRMMRRSTISDGAGLSIALVALIAGSARSAAASAVSAGPAARVNARTAGTITAEDLVAKWRKAVHAREWDESKTAFLTSLSHQDGIPGPIEEWVTATGDYRRVVDRKFDREETVLSGQVTARRDWNGFIRNLRGKELERWRTAAFECAVIAFGPPRRMTEAVVSESDDHTLYLLSLTPPGGAPMTWHVDARTWLPVKSVRPGEDSAITTIYEEWGGTGSIKTPQRARVNETEKPEYGWKRTGLRIETGAARRSFEAPKAGALDTRLDAKAPPIPFDFVNSHIIFKVRVNGREPLGFILDTGADQNVIHARRLSDYGLTTYAKSATTGGGNTAEYDYAEGATFTLPGVELRRQHVAVLDQTGLERALGVPLGGILGYDFISRFVVEIDYETKLITLHDPETWRYGGGGVSVPVTFDLGIPFAYGTISVPTKPAIPAYFVMDFGAAETMTLTSPFVKANDLQSLAGTNAYVNRPAGLEKQFFAQTNVRGHIDRLALGGLIVESIPVNMSVNTQGAYSSANFSGTVGEGIYHRYHAFLDYPHERIILEPTDEAVKPFPERQTYGLSLLASGPDLHTLTVSAVRPGSPAETDGFKEGDRIAAIDGRTAAEITLGDVRDRLSHQGEQHRLEIARGNEKLALAIEVRLVSLDRK